MSSPLSGPRPAAPDILDVDEADFAVEVVERSHDQPVVVDFWAAWCGPCRTLGPLLTEAVEARAGEVRLAKVDVDANPGLAGQYSVQGIPAVKGFRDGRVVASGVYVYVVEGGGQRRVGKIVVIR